MNLKDIKNYRGYIPLIFEEQKIINLLIFLTGKQFNNLLWFNKFNNRYIVRYRFGNKNIAQIYLKNKSWLDIPLPLWIKFSSLSLKELDNECWSWINNQKQLLNINNKKVNTISNNTNILDI